MSSSLALTLSFVFVAVTVLVVAIAWLATTRAETAGRRRLVELVQQRPTVVIPAETLAARTASPVWDSIAETLPTSRGTLKRLRRELALAGWDSPRTAAVFSIAEIVCPVIVVIVTWLLMKPGFERILGLMMGAIAGYLIPGFILGRRINKNKKQIQNGIADALDLLVLCLEAGSGLDQSLVKAGDELQVAYPALSDQLRLLISEMRAGKPRIEAFRALAARTQVEDVRSLVAMLVQTDRFGTSIAQALRGQADVCRTKRRQRAEEKAQKVSVKLVFPLVFCLFPALYVVLLGPAFIQFGKVLGSK
jgi:tight adherence protein C